MDNTVKRDLITVLTQSIFLIKKQDFVSLKELSNHIIHDASIVQDRFSIQTAIVVYALSKILEREKQKGKAIPEAITETLHKIVDSITKNDEQGADSAMKLLFNEIGKIDEEFPWHIQTVIDKAHVVKGSNMYRHGISIGRVAEILGVTQWDLMSYIGKTRIIDKERESIDVKSRLEFTRRLFNI